MPPQPSKRKKTNTAYDWAKKYLNFEFIYYLIFDPAALSIVSVLILVAELLINVVVINRVNYTEIDWKAYMQECEGFLNGTTNYDLLRGDTGPLVYPAAFVYIYSALYFITSHGQNVCLAQYIFAGVYLLQMWLALRLYTKSRKVPPFVLVISAFTSYRIHSIYVLRLFNDPISMIFLYAALNLFMDHLWTWGSVCFSLGVGVKMNILLFAPALLLFYIVNLGPRKTAVQLFICGAIQLLIGLPFLLTYPWQYIRGSFDLGRIFEHKWTVNYRFLPKSIFENKIFHLSLLALHLLLLGLFARQCYVYFKNYVRLRELQKQLQPQIARKNQELERERKNVKKIPSTEEELTFDQKAFLKTFEKSLQKSAGLNEAPKPQAKEERIEENVSIHFDQCTQLALLPFFVCNLIGIVCARSLHYQFYVWYFHSLPYLTWSTTYNLGLRFLLLGLIEFSWNTYPSTNFSSGVLHFCHVLLLIGVAHGMFRATSQNAAAVGVSQGVKHQNQANVKNKQKVK